MRYRCVKCHCNLSLPAEGTGSMACEKCSFKYEYGENYLKYEFDSILFEAYKEKYLLNKVLNNNGYLSYLFLADGSLSLNERDDVKNFQSYIQTYLSSGVILDVGCGILPCPGYLDFEDKSKFDFYGLDPIDDKSFSGMRVVGCAEYLPFDDAQFDAVVFATSLDHVCSLERTISECHRILNSGGRGLIWMSDHSTPSFQLKRLLERVSSFRIRRLVKRLKLRSKQKVPDPNGAVSKGKYVIYPNWTVLYVPDRAIDPFHSFQDSPQKIVNLMKAQGFQHNDLTYNDINQVFLCFTKVSSKASKR